MPHNARRLRPASLLTISFTAGRPAALLRVASALGVSALVAACTPRAKSDDGGGAAAGAASGAGESDTARIARLEREARALAHAEGCESSAGCRTAPVGHRACGGPREYLVYCAATTDSAALFRALDALARAEAEHQRKEGLVSTCEFRMPPNVSASGGRCVASTGVP